MEHPRLRVKSGGTEVVGDADIGSEVGKLVEGSPLGRGRVGGGEDAQGPTGLAVPPQGVEQRADAAASDERHHDVDGVR